MKAAKTVINAGSATINSVALATLIQELAQHGKKRIDLGVLGTTKNRQDAGTWKNPQGLTNAEIGLRNEFGVISEGVPERSFLRRPLMERLPGEINALGPQDWENYIIVKGMMTALWTLASLGEFVVLGAFGSFGYGKWAPNAPYTVFQKGFNNPLIHYGELRQSITWRVV